MQISRTRYVRDRLFDTENIMMNLGGSQDHARIIYNVYMFGTGWEVGAVTYSPREFTNIRRDTSPHRSNLQILRNNGNSLQSALVA